MHKIAISIDTTGSMYPCLASVRREVEELINTLFSTVPNLRLAIIAHGDYCDAHRPYITKHLNFTDNKDEIIDFVRNVERTSGGDADECYELVLRELQNHNWNDAETKTVILIGDAEPHNVGYRYNSTTYNLNWRDEAAMLVNGHGVNIYPVQCLNYYSSNYFYDELAKISGTVKLPLHQFKDINQLLSAVIYKQQGDEQLTTYANELDISGGLNRNLADIINSLLGEKKYDVPASSFYTRELEYITPSHSHVRFRKDALSDELTEVDPTRFQVLHVDATTDIKSFVNETGAVFKIGRGFYELTKPELVQEKKEVVLVDKSGKMLSGKPARDVIGVPYGIRGKAYPSKTREYKVFVQSTSANRKLIGGTQFLYEAK